jgi:hypothetical protein
MGHLWHAVILITFTLILDGLIQRRHQLVFYFERFRCYPGLRLTLFRRTTYPMDIISTDVYGYPRNPSQKGIPRTTPPSSISQVISLVSYSTVGKQSNQTRGYPVC